jgi:site-specific DNA-methyltransferase (adenine-specific)
VPKSGARVVGDDAPFDPAQLLALAKPTVLFGANHYAQRLPSSPGWIVWDKRFGMPSNDQSDAELAWTNFLGSVRTIRLTWNGGGSLLAENGPARAIHATQKPLRLMTAVLGLTPPGSVLDPYVGTGTTVVAAKLLGRRAIGIEIDERHCERAARRCSQEVLGLSA